MKASRRARRMKAHHARSKRSAALNMVSLMDIFTILVFFLLASSSAVQDLPSTKQIQLPESVADQAPRETVTIIVSDADVVVQGVKVASVADIMSSDSSEIVVLRQELERLTAQKFVATTTPGQPVAYDVTIMGDKEIPFNLLKKIMLTCTKASYTNISLAVMRKSEQG